MKPSKPKSDQKRKKKLSKPAPSKQSPETGSAEDHDERKDYGGLPDRDLKKNLGCG